MGTAIRREAEVPRHSAIGPSLRTMDRMSCTVDGCRAAAAATVLTQLPGGQLGWQLVMPHLLQRCSEAPWSTSPN